MPLMIFNLGDHKFKVMGGFNQGVKLSRNNGSLFIRASGN